MNHGLFSNGYNSLKTEFGFLKLTEINFLINTAAKEF